MVSCFLCGNFLTQMREVNRMKDGVRLWMDIEEIGLLLRNIDKH